jgi:hypothetical protein
VNRHRPHAARRVEARAKQEGRTLESDLRIQRARLRRALRIAKEEDDTQGIVRVVEAETRLMALAYGTKSKVTVASSEVSDEELAKRLERALADLKRTNNDT